VNSGTVDLSNGKPAVTPDGTDDLFDVSNIAASASIISVTEGTASTDGLLGNSAGSSYVTFTDNGAGTRYVIYRSNAYSPHSFSDTSGQRLYSCYATGAGDPRGVNVYLNGTAAAQNPVSLNMLAGIVKVLVRGSSYYDAPVQDLVVWSTDQTANRVAIETALAEYYGITIS
jgi:hypothetical protein